MFGVTPKTLSTCLLIRFVKKGTGFIPSLFIFCDIRFATLFLFFIESSVTGFLFIQLTISLTFTLVPAFVPSSIFSPYSLPVMLN